ncbi:MAG: peptidylprolyl isomerase [Pseudomonadales bacterium]|nr:peptidylprolyl isomerase [Pseudomonadales bacterium]
MRQRLILVAAMLLITPDLLAKEMVIIKTTMGDITVELYTARAPLTVANFLTYVDADGYRNVIFHRVIEGFVIQTGGLLADLSELAVREPVLNEADQGLKNISGSLAMARGAEIDSAERQFYINLNDNATLDHSEQSCTRADETKQAARLERGLYKPLTCKTFGYAVFGRVIQGMDVVQQIAQVATVDQDGYADLPLETIRVVKIERLSKKEIEAH